MRRKDEKLRRVILDSAMEMINAAGPDSINIRSIAEKSGVATGTVYNYFSGKDDILLAITEEYWNKTLDEMSESVKSPVFYEQLEEVYLFLSRRISGSLRMMMGSLRNAELSGLDRMKVMQQELGKKLIAYLEEDRTMRIDVWEDGFTKEQYADFIVTNLISLLRTRESDIDFFKEIVRRTLY